LSEGNTLYYILAMALIVLAAGRALLIRRKKLESVFKFLGWVEVGILGLLLGTLIVLGGLQIILRNIFHSGILWADPLMRHIVLWLGCLGAALATCKAQHINIDVFSRLVPDTIKPMRRSIVYIATAMATFLLGVSGMLLVLDEKIYGDIAFGSVPIWTMQLILPLAFFMISYRSMVNLFTGFEPDPLEGGQEVTEL
jgi:TRAP-type C4-dicarboxylate transport system permease small subunit